MKILQIFGAVVAVHLVAFLLIFASPGCQSSPRNVPTPDATVPTDSSAAPVTYNSSASAANPQPVDLGASVVTFNPASASGHATPTRPGSPSAAAVTPMKVAEDVSPVTTYTVGKGDSLWSIAKKNHLPVAELAKANNLPTGAALKPGKKLIIPGKPKTAATPKDAAVLAGPAALTAGATDKTATPSREVLKHTVQSGESLGVIARKYQVSVGELAAVNNITDPSKVRAGQQLIIPSGGKVAASKTSNAAGPKPVTTPKSAPGTPVAAQPATTTPPATSPHFEITAPPPGQDLDAGLKEATTEVPTIKVEDATAEQPPKK
jgi:LysM repeat protein